WLVFDPQVIPEVVDLSTRRPIVEGTGLLLLTELFPFSQMQPMVRLAVGDIFEVTPLPSGRSGFRCRGRLSNSVLAPDGALILTSMDARAALEPIPSIVRWPEGDLGGFVARHRCLDPPTFDAAWSVGDDRPQLTLTVPVDFDPRLFTEAADRTAAEAACRLRAESPELRSAVDTGRIDLVVSCTDAATVSGGRPAV
ncbi:MAG: hypothetical protein GVY28_02675, partial [Alphaproteobacteria bacterium]|nr:hypothetical protein [Alphaproteobacteria bacterium]